MQRKKTGNPPGRIKIIKALTELMGSKDFHSITTAEIADTAGVTEGLIYKYFKDKKDLLYQVLDELFTQFNDEVFREAAKKEDAINKLEVIISSSIHYYSINRVFGRMLLLEVRNSPIYFSSVAYEKVRSYARNILDIIQEGIHNGDIRSDIDPKVFRKLILGAIEHACIGEIIFSRELDTRAVTQQISDILFNGAKA